MQSVLRESFRGVEVEAFSPGSVNVDYYVLFNKIEEPLNTMDLKRIVADMSEQNDNHIGSYEIDPKYSDFIVVGELEPKPSVDPKDDGELLPQWGIAVVVIGMASLAFVLIFGISMMSKRRKISRAKGKQAMLTEEMVYEMNRSGSYGYGIDNPYAYGMDIESWKSDKMTNVRYKRGSSSSSGGGSGPYQTQMYDSWKTEWNPAYKDYHTSTSPAPKASYMTKGGRRPSYDDDF